MPAEELSDIHSCESDLEPSTQSTFLLDSRSHIARTSERTTKHERRGSLGLIDAARVRLSKDFRYLICSNSKLQRVHSASSSEAEGVEDHRFVYPDYANHMRLQPADLDIERMELTSDERPGRGLGNRIATFFNRSRSRSRSKKRRSRSLDAAISHDPMPVGGALHVSHPRHSSLEQDQQNTPVASSSNSRPATRSPSRPISSTTTATNTTVKPLPKKPPKSLPASPSASSRTPRPVDIHTEVVILEQTASNSRRGKKISLFGLSLSSPRKSSFGESNKARSRPTTPGPQPNGKGDRGLWGGRFRSNSGSTSHKSQDDANPFVKGDILWDNNRPPMPNTVTSQSRSAPIHVLTGPPLSHTEYACVDDDIDAEMSALSGRCSPLCGLGPTNVASAAQEKGKERERVREVRDRPSEHLQEKERERGLRSERMIDREKDRERITHPRRVGSPILREHERGPRVAIAAPPMEKVASGSGNSRQSRGKDGTSSTSVGAAALAARAKRIKHGSFDFERPVSAGAGGQTTFNITSRGAEAGLTDVPPALERSLSARGVVQSQESSPDRRVEFGRYQPSKAPDLQSKARMKPALDVNTQTPFLTRRPTGSSAATSTHPRSQPIPHPRGPVSKAHNGSETEPGSPISSTHSANSSGLNSSWGKSAGKRMGRPAHPSFKFEPAVPPIPGSPATDERKKPHAAGAPTDNHGNPGPGSVLSRTKPARATGKGRSLDLGLGLSWAPSRVREDAFLHTVPGADAGPRARSRWRGPGPDEEGRLAASGTASDVAETFREVLGDAAYATFKTYVHRFDAHAIPLDGPFGLIHHVQRLLDSAPGTDPRRKQALLDRFVRVVQQNR